MLIREINGWNPVWRWPPFAWHLFMPLKTSRMIHSCTEGMHSKPASRQVWTLYMAHGQGPVMHLLSVIIISDLKVFTVNVFIALFPCCREMSPAILSVTTPLPSRTQKEVASMHGSFLMLFSGYGCLPQIACSNYFPSLVKIVWWRTWRVIS